MSKATVEKKTVERSVREPLFHIAKRDVMPWWYGVAIRAAAIIIALVIAGVLAYILTGENPINIYTSMIKGSFGTSRKVWKLLKNMAVLLSISLAVTPAFKMKFWNIGAEGQVLIGGLASAACMFYMGGKVSDTVIIICMVGASIIAGAIWAFIPAVFKAKWNTNETLFTLMMNYIAAQLVMYFLQVWVTDGSSTLGELPFGHLPEIGHSYLLTILVAAALTIFMYIYLAYSKQGYEISVVGESQNTARYIGINVKKVIIRTMIISGALCGVAGLLIVGAIDHSITASAVGGQGFTAIMVSWLAKFNPIVMVLTTFLLVFLQIGSGQVSTDFNISAAFPDIITGIILFCIIGCEFFINYQIKFRKKSGEGEKK